MKTLRAALLIAATALAVTPALAQSAGDDAPRRDNHRAREDLRVGPGDDRGAPQPQRQQPARPAPPQAPAAPAAPSPPVARGNWAGGGDRGQEGRRDRGYRNDWNRGTGAAVPQPGAPPTADRSQWNRGDGGRWNRNDGQARVTGGDDRARQGGGNRGTDGQGGQYNRGDANGRIDWNDRRHDNGGRGYDQQGNRGGRDWNNNDRRNGNAYGRYDHRPNLNWRNDNRYDWRNYRDTHRDIFRGNRYRAPYGYGYRSVYRGFFLEPFFYGSNYWLADPYEYRLPPVEWPYRWVRYFDDALLVDTTTGEVVDVIQSFFY